MDFEASTVLFTIAAILFLFETNDVSLDPDSVCLRCSGKDLDRLLRFAVQNASHPPVGLHY